MEILLISGLSGSGKRTAAAILEDIGFYIVENLPAKMMVAFAQFCVASQGKYDRVAFVYDVRSGESAEEYSEALHKLREMNALCRVLYLDTDTATIIHRYKETRRKHPLAREGMTIESAVAQEEKLMRPVRESADMVINTSTYSTAKLRSELRELFAAGNNKEPLQVSVMSFGFKYGLPMEADLVLDVRFMPNPYYVDELKHHTGLEENVKRYVLSFAQTQEFLTKAKDLVAFLLPQYSQEGKSMVTVAFGCTGGRHRSVAIAHEMAAAISAGGYPTTESHRDISR